MGAQRDLVVVGGSAGGVELLKELVADLPADLPASVLVGLHLSSTARSILPQILARHSPMRVVASQDRAALEPGTVYVALPDHHLLVDDGRVALGRGARENGHRPSHDAMLRSAALARGPRTIGVVVTGLLDDGAAGLSCVARYGGTCIVQDPKDAEFGDMPRNALAAVPGALVVPGGGIAGAVIAAVAQEAPAPPEVRKDVRDHDLAELASAMANHPAQKQATPGKPSSFGCPDCHGVLNTVQEEGVLRFRCRTGHAWTAESLLAQQEVQVEQAIWTAVRVLEERMDVSRRLAADALSQRRRWAELHHASRADEAEQSARTLRELLTRSPASENKV